jgi:hypothetical protein
MNAMNAMHATTPILVCARTSLAEPIIDLVTVEPRRGLTERTAQGVGAEVGGKGAALYPKGIEAIVEHVPREKVHAGRGHFLYVALQGLDHIDQDHAVEPAQVPAPGRRLEGGLVEGALDVEEQVPEIRTRAVVIVRGAAASSGSGSTWVRMSRSFRDVSRPAITSSDSGML